MAQLRLRIEINKGRRGVPLDKLEKVLRETRKFLSLIAQDLAVADPSQWSGVDFKNGSLSCTALHNVAVTPPVYSRFTTGIKELAVNHAPAFVRDVTAEQFRELVSPLEVDEPLRLGIFPEAGKRLKWLSITRSDMALPKGLVLTERASIGSVQGTIHSLFKEAGEPHFYLRDLFSGALVKCFYGEEEYPEIVEALRVPSRVVHAHGRIFRVSGEKNEISRIEVDRLLMARPYTFEDVRSFLYEGKPQ